MRWRSREAVSSLLWPSSSGTFASPIASVSLTRAAGSVRENVPAKTQNRALKAWRRPLQQITNSLCRSSTPSIVYVGI
jgi:hypothetical protein